jgi:hypothetical protein
MHLKLKSPRRHAEFVAMDRQRVVFLIRFEKKYFLEIFLLQPDEPGRDIAADSPEAEIDLGQGVEYTGVEISQHVVVVWGRSNDGRRPKVSDELSSEVENLN